MTRKRKKIKYRNALTEFWNEGHSIKQIALFMGLSEDEIKKRLKAARAGFNTSRDQMEAADRKAALKAAKKVK